MRKKTFGIINWFQNFQSSLCSLRGKRQRNVRINCSFCSQNKSGAVANSLHHAFPGMLIILSEWKNKGTVIKEAKVKEKCFSENKETWMTRGRKRRMKIPDISQQRVKRERFLLYKSLIVHCFLNIFKCICVVSVATCSSSFVTLLSSLSFGLDQPSSLVINFLTQFHTSSLFL